MKAWVFVEGPSDRLGLEVLWQPWRQRLQARRVGIAIIPLVNKAQFLRKFGERAAVKLVENAGDVVVGLPDLHPTDPFRKDARVRHEDAEGLKRIQRTAVLRALQATHGLSTEQAEQYAQRCFPSLFKHDFEMLLLAAKQELRDALGTAEALGSWRVPVEDQNLDRPPKRVVEELFRTKSARRRSYLDTKDAPAVLRRVGDLRAILRTPSGGWTCPEFVGMLRWLGDRLGEHCCSFEEA